MGKKNRFYMSWGEPGGRADSRGADPGGGAQEAEPQARFGGGDGGSVLPGAGAAATGHMASVAPAFHHLTRARRRHLVHRGLVAIPKEQYMMLHYSSNNIACH